MKRFLLFLVAVSLGVSLMVAGCGQAAPAPTAVPAKPPAAAPTKAPEPAKPAATAAPATAPTKAPATAAPAAPTKAPAPAPTAAPAKKVDFPQKGKSITFIVPWGAGSSSDNGARMLAAQMEKVLGVPVQVVNKTGANSQIGLTELAQSKPDGYTIGLTNLPTTAMTYLDPEMKTIYNRKSFAPLGHFTFEPLFPAVKGDSPYKTAKDMADFAKANPEKVTVATTGPRGMTHVAFVLWEKAAGIKFAYVHFDSGAQDVAAILGGHTVTSPLATSLAVPHIKSGDMRLLGVMDKKRNAFFPDVPTMDEQGFKGVNMSMYNGISAPAGTPKEIMDILSDAIKKGMETEDIKKRTFDMGRTLQFMTPEQFGAVWDEMEKSVQPLLGELSTK